MEKQLTFIQLISKLKNNNYDNFEIYLEHKDGKHKIDNINVLNYMNNFVINYKEENDTLIVVLSD